MADFDWNAVTIHLDGEITEEERYQAFKARLADERSEAMGGDRTCPKCRAPASYVNHGTTTCAGCGRDRENNDE